LKPTILRLEITNFRGIRHLEWFPGPNVNVILGGGDTGKTTILEAVQLLLHPSNYFPLAETDYWRRAVEEGFEIAAVMKLPTELLSRQAVMNWPWIWNDQRLVSPDPDAEPSNDETPAYYLRVRGTEDLELIYEVVQPNDETAPLGVALRRSIGLLRLIADDRAERDLRLVSGSALDRLVSDATLRSRLGRSLSSTDVVESLSAEGKEALKSLDTTFRAKGLPSDLTLRLAGSPGSSIGAFVGLSADHDGVDMPLMCWGGGTRRLSALAIADQVQGERPITVVDEMERGLEPYRVRVFGAALIATESQSFVSTHSPVAISALADQAFWHLSPNGVLGAIRGSKAAEYRSRDPEAFLAKLAILCEGVTEVGFASVILPYALNVSLLDHGVWLSDARGHEVALEVLEALRNGGVRAGAIVDDEGSFSGRWDSLKASMDGLILQWPGSCIEEFVLPLFTSDELESVISDIDNEYTGTRLRHLADRLGVDSTDFKVIKESAGEDLLTLIIQAATGAVPAETPPSRAKEFRAHSRAWFKRLKGGVELAQKVIDLGKWDLLERTISPFTAAVANELSLRTTDE
jgi:putative ATP-dependent endonuclease of the OLD family